MLTSENTLIIPPSKEFQCSTLTQEELKQVVSYNPESGKFKWLSRKKGRNPKGNIGAPRPDGRFRLCINGARYLTSRLAWLYTYGYFPEGFIDHINRDPSDDRISNLRLVTHSQNMKNCKLSKKNTSGYKGVSLHRNKWRAQIRNNNSRIDLGYFSTKELAFEAYCEASRRLHKDFSSPERRAV